MLLTYEKFAEGRNLVREEGRTEEKCAIKRQSFYIFMLIYELYSKRKYRKRGSKKRKTLARSEKRFITIYIIRTLIVFECG